AAVRLLQFPSEGPITCGRISRIRLRQEIHGLLQHVSRVGKAHRAKSLDGFRRQNARWTGKELLEASIQDSNLAPVGGEQMTGGRGDLLEFPKDRVRGIDFDLPNVWRKTLPVERHSDVLLLGELPHVLAHRRLAPTLARM